MIKEVLHASPVQVDPMDYFDDNKQVFNTVPVFPFLSEEEVQQAINVSIDPDAYVKELKAIIKEAESNHSKVINTSYLISLVDWHTHPQLIQLLTILREWAFRNEGGGVGQNDFDEFDELPRMQQLIILDTEADSIIGSIIGGYRFMVHDAESYSTGPVGAHFEFSEKWKSEKWIELGRSFINPWYQQRHQRLSFDLVLHGLGYIYAKNTDAKGYFGKITLYNIYERQGADAFFLGVARKYLRQTRDMHVFDDEKVPEGKLTNAQIKVLDNDVFKGMFYLLRKQYKINLVPIMAVYNRMTKLTNMYYCGAFKHHSFGDSIEMGMAIAFEDIYETIFEKFGRPYLND